MLTAEKFREILKEDDFELIGVTMLGFLMKEAFHDLNDRHALTEGSSEILMDLIKDIACIRADKLKVTINFLNSPFN
jgi:hypothetical protein